MQPIRQLDQVLARLADAEHYLFGAADLQAAVAGADRRSLAVLLSRAEKTGLLRRVCRGIYLYPRVDYPRGRVLFHAAARLRAETFNYISLETALSDAGIVSQVPIDRITVMSSGRTNTVSCGAFGTIEFVHTARRPEDLAGRLTYDRACRLWRARPALALQDMQRTRRSTRNLIDRRAAHERV
jgi:predicted transcriptional regulator of viral defense system